MTRRRFLHEHRPVVRQVALLLVMPLFVVGASYALFSQTLTINGGGELPKYVSNNYTTVTYTKAVSLSGSTYTYTLNPLTVINNGVTSITAWTITFQVPADVTSITCPTSITCSINTTTDIVTLTDTVTVAAGGTNVVSSSTRPIKFSTKTANYALQNVTVSATYSTSYAAISGLTVVATAGTKVSGKYPLTVTITNNSGQPISGWQVTVPTKATCTSTTVTGVTYTCTTTVLTYTGAAIAIADGAQYQFSTSVTYTPTTWTTSGAAVKGKA